jgi:hypothetical protein
LIEPKINALLEQFYVFPRFDRPECQPSRCRRSNKLNVESFDETRTSFRRHRRCVKPCFICRKLIRINEMLPLACALQIF